MVTCGRCSKDARDHGTISGEPIIKHSTSAEVRACYAAPVSRHADMMDAYYAEEAAAEAAAEARAERFWEEGTSAQQMQYAWEVEMDERNAAFWGGRF